MAPLPAVGFPAFRLTPKSSYSTQDPSSIMIACRSEPPSIRTSFPNGYGPGSLSSS